MQKENFQIKTDKLIASLGESKPRLLLHSCCGPCSSYVLEYLSRHFELTVLFYGPNIQPEEEYALRLEHQMKVLEHVKADFMPCDYDGEAFEAIVRGYEQEIEGGERCTRCFALRIEETARRAAEGGFDYYCTTLSVSPHKDAQRINALGEEFGEKYGVKWLPSDFKKRGGYQRSIALSREWELYRQDYCGCLFSKRENE